MKEILLPINPCYVEKILSGDKKVEYRKWIPNCELPFKVHVYSTHPIQKVVGTFIVTSILEDAPQDLWEKTKDFGGTDSQFFFLYFKNSDTAFAWAIEDVEIFISPLDLSYYNISSAPQRFCYLQ